MSTNPGISLPVLEPTDPSLVENDSTRSNNGLNGVSSSRHPSRSNHSRTIEFSAPANTPSGFAPPQLSINEMDGNGVDEDLRINIQAFREADEAFSVLASEYKGESIAQRLINDTLPPEHLSLVGNMLEAWQEATQKYFYMDARPQEYFYAPLKDRWDELALDQTEHIQEVLGVDFDTLATDCFEGEGQIPQGIDALQHLLTSPDFEHKEQLSNFVMHAGWRAKRAFFRTNPDSNSESYIRDRYLYEYTKFECNQLLRDSAVVLAQKGNFEQVGQIFDHLAFSEVPLQGQFKPEDFPNAMDDARAILLNGGFNAEQRKGVLREFVKVYGPIQAVDTLSRKIGDLREAGATGADPYVQGLVEMYSLIEGEDVADPMANLTRVYEVVDYADLERPELTEKEATMVEGVLDLFAEAVEYSTVNGEVKRLVAPKNGGTYYAKVDPHNVRAVDLGAGNARVSRELFKRGYRNLLALENDPKHARVARERAPDDSFVIVRGDWHNLPLASSDYLDFESSIQVGFTTERSFLHNRTAQEWFSLFDEFRRVSHPRAFMLLDVPDSESGVYKERIDDFRQNLEENLQISDIESRVIFDGPGKVKYNRMAITDEQLRIYSKLFGFVVVGEPERDERPEDNMTNVYYTLAKDQNFVFGDIGKEELWEDLYTLGMLDYDVDYNMYVESWGMTLGQALLFGPDYAGSFHSSPYVEAMFKKKRGPKVWVDKKGGRINLRSEWPSYD